MHIQGQSRHQATLFPERLDELIIGDNPVRVIDAFVDALDLQTLGFAKVESEATGRPPYDPGDLLKLYMAICTGLAAPEGWNTSATRM
jgi:transposase